MVTRREAQGFAFSAWAGFFFWRKYFDFSVEWTILRVVGKGAGIDIVFSFANNLNEGNTYEKI